MTKYFANIINREFQTEREVVLDCIDDKSALKAASQFVDGRDVEVWQGSRKIGTIHHIK